MVLLQNLRNSLEQIDVSGFTNGVYLVAVTNPETGLKSVKRVIKE